MICPFATVLGLGAVASGSERLLLRDRRYRAIAWSATALLGLAWFAYFTVLRAHGVRVALEVVSVLALVLATWRVRHLVRSGQVAPLLGGRVGRAFEPLGYAVRSPWVAGAKAWLLAMGVFHALGRAHFTVPEYAAATAVLVAFVAVRLARRARAPRFGSLARYGDAATPAATCPLGFGCATPTAGGQAGAHDSGPRAPSR